MPNSFHRTVVSSTAGAPYERQSSHLVVMQLNALCDYLEPEPLDPDDPASVRAVQFAHRKHLLLEHILHHAPSVLVMQEVDHPDDWFGPELRKHGYEFVAAAKKQASPPKRPRGLDHTCVFYRTDEIELAAEFERHRFAAGESQFALLCTLRQRSTSAAFVVVAQHAKAGRKEAMEDRRLRHAARITQNFLPSYLHKLEAAGVQVGDRVLWAGDFNAGPHSYGGKYPARVVPWILSEVPGASYFVDADAQAGDKVVLPPCPQPWESLMVQATGAHPELTTAKIRAGIHIIQTIDYVLALRGACRCVGWLPCPPATDGAPLCLPNGEWGSDHLSVLCAVEWG